MIDQNTIDTITDWATNKYAGSASPSLTAAAAPASTAPGAPVTGMIGAGVDTLSASAPPTGATAPGAAATTPTSTPDSTWSTATQPTTNTTSTTLGTPAPPVNSAPGSWASTHPLTTKQYNGQDVIVGDQEMAMIADAATSYNKAMGTTLTPQQYDQKMNPNTYGARWGIPESGAGTGTGSTFQVNPPIASGPTLLDPATLAQRTIDAKNETVNGQLQGILAQDSPVLQQARAAAMTAANDRGMLNSTLAASGGEDAAIRSALQIATPDAAAYGHAADYNAAATNQAKMFNSTAANDFAKQQIQLTADKAAQAAQLGQQMTISQMQDATTRFNTETNTATSKYNTDAQYKQQADNNKKTLVNNIVGNMDLSPDRKAAMLAQLGEGTSAVKNPDGSVTPGTGLAGAVYVIDSVAADLNFAGAANG